MFKDEYKRMNDAIRPGSELLERTERSMAEIMNKKDAKRMSAKMVVALAVACALALTGVAFATGAIQSVFGWMKSSGIREDTDFERLNELADSELGVQTVQTEYGGEASVELSQVYYDGNQLIVGAKYMIGTGNAIVGLEHELMNRTRQGDEAFCAVRFEENNMPLAINQQGTIPEKSSLIPSYIAANMTDEQIQAFEKEYAENGEAGAVVYSGVMADQIQVAGDADDELCPQTDVWSKEPDGAVWRYVDFGMLPEACSGQDRLTVKFGIIQKADVVRADADGVWVASAKLDKAEFVFEVDRNDQQTCFAYGSFENEIYAAKVELRINEVSSRVIVDMTRPEEWSKADSVAMTIGDGEVDYIWDYCAIMPDGSWESVMEQNYPTETGCRMEGTIKLSEDQREIILRPRYNKSGLVEGEDIVISLENGISSVK